MDVKVFLIADYANIDNSGKLNILGVFSTIFVPNFPVMHPQLHIVIKLAFDWGEFGQDRELILKLFDPDGKELATIPRPFHVPSPKFGQTAEVNAIIGVRDLVFEKPGKYELRLFVDKDHKDTLTIDLTQLAIQQEE